MNNLYSIGDNRFVVVKFGRTYPAAIIDVLKVESLNTGTTRYDYLLEFRPNCTVSRTEQMLTNRLERIQKEKNS